MQDEIRSGHTPQGLTGHHHPLRVAQWPNASHRLKAPDHQLPAATRICQVARTHGQTPGVDEQQVPGSRSGTKPADDVVAAPDLAVEKNQQSPPLVLSPLPPTSVRAAAAVLLPEGDASRGVARSIETGEGLTADLNAVSVPSAAGLNAGRSRRAIGRRHRPLRVGDGPRPLPQGGDEAEAVMQSIGAEGIGVPFGVNAFPALPSRPDVVGQPITRHHDPITHKGVIRQQDMKRPPPGSRDPVGESRGNVRAVIVRQRVEMNEHTGTLAVPSIVAPQEGRLAHRDAVNEASLPQHRGATSRCGREGIVVGLPRPPCRRCRKKAAPRRHGGRRQLSPPGLAHQNIVRTDTAHTTTLSDVARPPNGCGVCSNDRSRLTSDGPYGKMSLHSSGRHGVGCRP